MKQTDKNTIKLRKIIREELMSVLPSIIADTIVKMNSAIQENTEARGVVNEYQNDKKINKGNTINKKRSAPMLSVKDILNNTSPFDGRGTIKSMINDYTFETAESVIDADEMDIIDAPRETKISENKKGGTSILNKDYRSILKGMEEAAERIRG